MPRSQSHSFFCAPALLPKLQKRKCRKCNNVAFQRARLAFPQVLFLDRNSLIKLVKSEVNWIFASKLFKLRKFSTSRLPLVGQTVLESVLLVVPVLTSLAGWDEIQKKIF